LRPTSTELLTSIAEALDSQVLPAIVDPWAASTTRSASQLLRHLALRVEVEPRLLLDEITGLSVMLQEVRRNFPSTVLADVLESIDAALGLPDAGTDDLPGLRGKLTALSSAAEMVVAARDRIRELTGNLAIHELVVDCLLAQAERERALFEPFQSLPPI
jgi:hypothetical protein